MVDTNQLKSRIKKIAQEKNISPQLVMKSYMMDRLLELISLSNYQDKFILKGGFLIGTRYGIENRTTQDIDTTIRNISLTEEKISRIFEEICLEESPDNILFSLKSIRPIREAFQYNGFEVNLTASLGRISEPMKIDVTTGDSIFPEVRVEHHQLMGSTRSVEIYSYPSEQILAEKLSAFFVHGERSTRSKDLYDIHTISSLEEMDMKVLEESIRKTFNQRGLSETIESYFDKNFQAIKNSQVVQERWFVYTQNNSFANQISFEEVINSVEKLLDQIIQQEKELDISYMQLVDEHSEDELEMD